MARGWPAVLREDDVVLRPLRRADGPAWLALRARNEAWLRP
ncbi:MAG: alanine acetyltransferase, partial [Actinomycetales bacterium]|nr:alanine acetyltransferase [Actinomycetales bacterium]